MRLKHYCHFVWRWLEIGYADAPTIDVGVTTADDADGEDDDGCCCCCCCDSLEEDNAAAADTASLVFHEYADTDIAAAAAAAAAAAELLYGEDPIISGEVGELDAIIAEADEVGESCEC